MCVSVLFNWLPPLEPEIESRHRPVVGELRDQITVPEFRFFVLVAEHYAVSLSLTYPCRRTDPEQARCLWSRQS